MNRTPEAAMELRNAVAAAVATQVRRQKLLWRPRRRGVGRQRRP
jgi:hypothetical protein